MTVTILKGFSNFFVSKPSKPNNFHFNKYFYVLLDIVLVIPVTILQSIYYVSTVKSIPCKETMRLGFEAKCITWVSKNFLLL